MTIHRHCELGSEKTLRGHTLSSIDLYYRQNTSFENITNKGEHFIDEKGRVVLFRGINIAAKTPLTDLSKGFSVSKGEWASFVNTPFSLDEAYIHFSRLKYLGFNLLRWVVPWEALCPITPSKVDSFYLEYLDRIIAIAKDYGFSVLIDFHQDVWSRFTGGSGAPYWTLEKVGLNVSNFDETLASISHKNKARYPLGHLFWATNANRYAVKTMFTLFFGGKTFAPDFEIDGKNVQDFLQDNYIEAIAQCAEKLKKHDHIIGFDVMNEPYLGFIGEKDLSKHQGIFRLGPSPLPLEGFALAEGVCQDVDVFEKRLLGIKATHKVSYDPKGKSALFDGICIWRKYRVWDYDEEKNPQLLRKDYFQTPSPNEEFYIPFIEKVCKRLLEIDPKKINFLEHVMGLPIPKLTKTSYKVGFSGHWYDAFVISMRKVWSFISVDMFTQKIVVSLPHFVQKHLASQIFLILKKVKKNLGSIPFLLSEFGIPFDLHRKKAYANGNYRKQREGLERSFQAVEKTMVSSIIWNYTSVNSNEKGDLWNNEDFSIFSTDQVHGSEDPYAGIRGKEAIVRPYPEKIPGELIKYSFDREHGIFSCSFIHNPEIKDPLEVFIPDIHFGRGFEVENSQGHYQVCYEKQKLYFFPESVTLKTHKVRILKKHKLKERRNKSYWFFS